MSGSEGEHSPISLIAGEDLTGHLFKLVKVSAANTVIRTAATTDKPIGVLAGENISGGVVPVLPLIGRLKVKAGGSITAGQGLVTDNAGQVTGVALASLANNQLSIGVALQDGSSGDIIEFWAMPFSQGAV